MDRESVLHRDRIQSAEGRSETVAAFLGQTMKIRVLGCSGGIGGGLRTTSLLVDEDILIDAGTVWFAGTAVMRRPPSSTVSPTRISR